MVLVRIFGSVLLVFICSQAWAQSEPIDLNNPGPFAGVRLGLGQAAQPGSSATPGASWSVAGDLGYVVKRDTWGRIELGVELGTGSLSYKNETDIDIDLKTSALVKVGYGYSLGDHAFGVFRLGVGVASAEWKSESTSATVTSLAWDAVLPLSDVLYANLGLDYRFYSFSWDELGGIQVNTPTVYAGMRWML